MELKVQTKVLQDMLSKAVKGASNNRMIPLTSLIAVEWVDGNLTLTTTDATNTLKVIHPMEGNPFYIVVSSDFFSKLVARITTEFVTLALTDNSLEITGNGVYKVELPLDEQGKPIRFPNKQGKGDAVSFTVKKAHVKSMLNVNRAALATSMEVPVLTAYYLGEDIVVTTDSFKVCSNRVGFAPFPMLIGRSTMELLDIFEVDDINVTAQGNLLVFESPTVVLRTTQYPGIEDFPIEPVKAYLTTEFQWRVCVNKEDLLEVLDRLTLFVTEYDQNGIYLMFEEDGLWIKSRKSSGIEKLPYVEQINLNSGFQCFIDIELLRSQILAQNNSSVQIWYGHDRALKLESDTVTQVISLLTENE